MHYFKLQDGELVEEELLEDGQYVDLIVYEPSCRPEIFLCDNKETAAAKAVEIITDEYVDYMDRLKQNPHWFKKFEEATTLLNRLDVWNQWANLDETVSFELDPIKVKGSWVR